MTQPTALRVLLDNRQMVGLVVWLFLGVIVCNPSLGLAQSAASETPPQFIKAHQVEEKQMRGGENHQYLLELPVGHYLKLVVEQKGIDVNVVLAGPDGAVMCQVDSPNGTQGPEHLSWVSSTAGVYQLKIVSSSKIAPVGTYELKILSLGPASTRDIQTHEVETLLQKVSLANQAGKYDEGITLATETLTKAEAAFGPEHLLVADAVNYLGVFAYRKNEFPKAEALYQRGLTIREKLTGSESEQVAESLSNLALVYYKIGEYPKSEPLYQKSLAIKEKLFGAEHPLVAASLHNFGILYRAWGDYPKAEAILKRALAMKERFFGKEHREASLTMNELALVYQETANYRQAELLQKRVLELNEKAFGPDHHFVATNLNNLGLIYAQLGEYTQAEVLYRRALKIREKAFGPNHPGVALILGNLGGLCHDRGDYAKAKELFHQALAIDEKVYGADHPNVLNTLNNLASASLNQKEYDEAEALYLRILAAREKRLGPDHPDVAWVLNSLAATYGQQGLYDKSETFLRRALSIREKILKPDHPDIAQSYHRFGFLYEKKGDLKQAEKYYQQALGTQEKSLEPTHPRMAEILRDLAKIQEMNRDFTQALTSKIRENEIIELNWRRNLLSGSERQKLLYVKQTAQSFERMINLQVQALSQNPLAIREALLAVLRRKGRVLDAMALSIEHLRDRATPADQQLLDQVIAAKTQLSNLTLKGPGKDGVEIHRAKLKELEDQIDQFEAQISARSFEFRAQFEPITIEAVQAALPSDAVLIEFLVYYPYDLKLKKNGSPRYIAYILTPTGDPKWVDLGDAATIDELVAQFRSALSDRSQKGMAQVAPLSRKLYQMVLHPVVKLVGQPQRFFLSPDGMLNLVPFAALMDERQKYVVEQFKLTYLTSGRDLLHLKIKVPSQTPPLLVVDPDYAQGPGPQLLGVTYPPLVRLPGTAREGKQVQQYFENTQLKTGADATEQAIKAADRPLLLHIATHGSFLNDVTPPPVEPESQRNLTPVGSGLDMDQVRNTHSLLRSYLFFAGANTRSTTDNDGTLTALEAANLNLWGTKLVVLSACNTGVGDVKTGEGVYGLRRALVLAGSESQMMSLWPVSDQGTQVLMTEYYRRLKASEGRSDALQNTQLWMLKHPHWKHPFYWASFIQSGEWKPISE